LFTQFVGKDHFIFVAIYVGADFQKNLHARDQALFLFG